MSRDEMTEIAQRLPKCGIQVEENTKFGLSFFTAFFGAGNEREEFCLRRKIAVRRTLRSGAAGCFGLGWWTICHGAVPPKKSRD
jgi:hypothetical protein